jgi:hypothetical protein
MKTSSSNKKIDVELRETYAYQKAKQSEVVVTEIQKTRLDLLERGIKHALEWTVNLLDTLPLPLKVEIHQTKNEIHIDNSGSNNEINLEINQKD